MIHKMVLYFNGNEYCLFIHNDAWLIMKDGSFMYQCRQKTLANPTTWTPRAIVIHYSEAPEQIRDVIDVIKDTEYYQPRHGDIYEG
jgi:hypothetical protein